MGWLAAAFQQIYRHLPLAFDLNAAARLKPVLVVQQALDVEESSDVPIPPGFCIVGSDMERLRGYMLGEGR